MRINHLRAAGISLFAALSIVTLAFSTGCSDNSSQPTVGALKLGAVLPLTGESAAWGEQGRWGIDYAITEANQKGGINGRMIEVIYEDSQAIPRVGVTAANKLINVDKVPAIIGDIVSSTTLAMAPIVEEKKVILIGISCSAPPITKAGNFVFRVWPSDNLEGAAAADWARSKSFGKAGVLHIANDYGQGLAQVFKERFESKGGTVSVIQSYAQDQTDFRANLARLKSDTPAAVYLISYYKDAALILRQAREVGINAQFIGATAVESEYLLKTAGDAAEGLVYPTIVDFDPDNPTDAQREFIEKFSKKNGKKPDWASSHAYDAAAVILEAIRSGANSGAEIQAAIDKQRRFKGITGTITFDANGDVIEKPVVMKTVRNGKFVRLEQ